MTNKLLRFVGPEHFRLGIEALLELAIVDTRVTSEQHERNAFAHVEGKCLRNAIRLATNDFSSKLNRGT